MTDNTQPEALRLANVCSNLTRHSMDAHLIAAELRRQHARIAELEAQLEAIGAGGVQALSAAPAAKKSALRTYPNPIVPLIKPVSEQEKMRALYLASSNLMAYLGRNGAIHSDGHAADAMMDCLNDLDGGGFDETLFAASPTPPAEQQATKETSGGFHVWRDISTAPKDGSRFVATGHNYGLYSEVRHTCVAQWFRGCWMEASDWNETSELKYLTHWMPLPSPPDDVAAPAEQQAAPKAAQYEMDKEASNVRLDIDSNSTKPEQQRDVACSLEVGQHVGNGEHQGASCRGSEDSELLNIAARNLKYFIEHAQFSSFADKRAALNCLDALGAPPAEQAAPKAAPGEPFDECFPGEPRVAVPQGLISAACFAIRNKRDGGKVLEQLRRYSVGDLSQPLAPQQEAQEAVAWQGAHDPTDLYYTKPLQADVRPLYTAPQAAPAPLSDDVVKDAARYRWLRDPENGGDLSVAKWLSVCDEYPRYEEVEWYYSKELDAAIDAALAAQGGKV